MYDGVLMLSPHVFLHRRYTTLSDICRKILWWCLLVFLCAGHASSPWLISSHQCGSVCWQSPIFCPPESTSSYPTPPGLSAHPFFPIRPHTACALSLTSEDPHYHPFPSGHVFPDRVVSPRLVTKFTGICPFCIDNLWDQDISMDTSLAMARCKHKSSSLYLLRDHPLNPGGRHWWNVIPWNYDTSGMLGCSQALEIGSFMHCSSAANCIYLCTQHVCIRWQNIYSLPSFSFSCPLMLSTACWAN